MNLAQFPLFVTTLNGRSHEMVSKALVAVTNGVDSGEIPNVVYKDTVKFYIGRAFEKAWDELVRKSFNYNREIELTEAEIALSYTLPHYPEAHKIDGMLKKIAKSGVDTEYTRAMIALLTEIAPIGAAIVGLKDKIVKRQPKPVEDRKEKYLSPIAGKEAIFQVKATLVQVTEVAKVKLSQRIAANLTVQFERAKVLVTELIALSSSLNTAEGRKAHYAAQQTYSRFMGRETFLYNLIDRHGAIVRNAAALIVAEANKRSAEIRENFVYKNLEKIDSILERKGDFTSINIIGHDISIEGLTGSFRLIFDDGASFEMSNSVVYVVNTYGTQFNRFPLTFHNVVMNGGRRMKMPSEQKMNEVFPHKELA